MTFTTKWYNIYEVTTLNYIEKFESKITTFDYFAVDFDDKCIILHNKKLPLGYISNCIANLSKDDVTNLLIHSGKINQHWQKLKLDGYSRKLFQNIFADINKMIDYMQTLKPFKYFDVDKSRDTILNLFGDNALDDYEYLLQHLTINYATMNDTEIKKLEEIENKSKMAESVLRTYSYIGLDTANFGTMIINYVENFIKEDSRTQENIAKFTCDFFDNEEIQKRLATSNPAAMVMDGFSLKPHQSVVPTIKIEKGKYKIIRRMYFGRMMDFFVTEFFEALTNGHYVWKCGVCNKYFLMNTAHKQLYCNTVNKEYGVPCSYVAKHPEITKRKMEKQSKTDSPYYILWKKRYNSIRKNKSLGKYNEAVSAKAKKIIDMKFEKAQIDFDYAENHYQKEMVLDNIYDEAMK